MKKTLLGIVLLVSISLTFIIGLSSCADKTGRAELRKKMLSDFTAEIQYTHDTVNGPVCGTAVVTKDDKLRLELVSPEPFGGMSVECDPDGEATLISIAYSGAKSVLPQESVEKLVFLMNMMSESTASALEGVPKKAYKSCEEYMPEDNKQAIPYEVSFSHNNTEYLIIYDSLTGMPLEIFASNGYCKAEIKIKELKNTETLSEE